MAKKLVRTECLEGVQIKIVSKKNSFDVSITVRAGTYLWQPRQNDNCWVKFETDYDDRITVSDVKFKLTNQPYYRKQLLKYFKKTFCMRNGGKCTIALFPNFFLPEDLAEMSRLEREKKDAKDCKPIFRRTVCS